MQQEPDDGVAAKLLAAVKLHGEGRQAEAERLYKDIINTHPTNADAWHLLGVVAYQRRDFAAAVERIRTAIAISDTNAAFHSNLGLALHAAGRLAEALTSYRRAVALQPDYADAQYNLGNALQQAGELEEAAVWYGRAVSLRPDFVEAHNNLGNVLRRLGRLDDAATSYRAALALQPRLAGAHNNLGNVLRALHRLEDAVASYREALALKPDFADAWNNLGNTLQEQNRPAEAMTAYERALALRPDFADAWNNFGNALDGQGRLGDAEAAFRRAIGVAPDHVNAHFNLALVLQAQGRTTEAAASYDAVLALAPDHSEARLRRFNLKLHVCDWADMAADAAAIEKLVAADRLDADPYFLIFVPGISAAGQRRAATAYARRRFAHFHPHRPVPVRQDSPDRALRVGYLSADFHAHATAYLMAEIFELHDRTRVLPIAYSLGADDGSEMRRRLVASFDEFHDVSRMSFDTAAARIEADRIDILVDLKGYTSGARPEILALRPAPLQVSYLAYPATMGAEFVDYLIADRFICPPGAVENYTEALAWMPDCYQPNDRRRRVADEVPPRSALGLPDDGFVFCSFNGHYKITPQIFDVWMTLLRDVPGSVLWLIADNDAAQANLRREADSRGIAAERLVFAPKLPLPDHLARLARADLFLDTLPCSAHTTASDALWAGLPVLTCAGDTFAGRVGGSVVRAAGLPELVVETIDEYARLARQLATHCDDLSALRARLQRQRLTCPLFDSVRTTRDLERLYAAMWRRHVAGEPPAVIDLGDRR